MKEQTQKALEDYTTVRGRIEKLITTGKIDLHKPSCLYSKKEMMMVKRLLEKEKKARERYYALLSKDMQLEIAELCGVMPGSSKKRGHRCCGCNKTGGK
jgi:hypothetical protein